MIRLKVRNSQRILHSSPVRSYVSYGAGRLKKISGFSAKYEAQNIFFIDSISSNFRLQRAALGALDFQTPCYGVLLVSILNKNECVIRRFNYM